jgi:PAS domain S-box-containing protein
MLAENERDAVDELSGFLLDVMMLAKPPQIPDCFASVDSVQTLYARLLSLREILFAASNGDLSKQVSLRGYIGGALKTLQANLKHMTWQTKMVASGDFTQRVEFMGEFSHSFNAMVVQLDQILTELAKKELELNTKNDQLLNEISIRKQAEAAIRESEERLALALKATRDAIWDWDLVTDDHYYSTNWWSMVGYKANELDTHSDLWCRLIHPEDLEHTDRAVSIAIARDASFEIETRLLHRAGHYVPVLTRGFILRDNNGKAIRVSGTTTDLTEHKRTEEERRQFERQQQQIEKAESLNRMAGAIAHHFNNMLGAVMGNLELALTDLPQGLDTVDFLNEAMKASQRAAEVSSLMLTYLGQTVTRRELLNLSDTCRSSLPLLKVTIQKGVVLETDFSSPGPTITANVSQVQQLLINLFANASEAIGDSGGSIHLAVKTVSLADISIKHRFPISWKPQGNAFACIEITDTGAGIVDKDIEQIFDPFFSTKFTGRGLGLPVVLGIVRAHNGVITMESTLGQGSVFRVYFPLSLQSVSLQPEEQSAHTLKKNGDDTILLVEDEEIVRNMATTMLNHLGFKVLEARDGIEAVEIFQQQKDNINAVLCDLTMPRMDGWETLASLRELAPEIPVILSSGYNEAQVMVGDHTEWPQSYLGKPYMLEELRLAINRVFKKGHNRVF